jgi:rRNA-processing protein FCF1
MSVFFLDTMIFLHYQPIEQIDWLAMTSEPQVEIVVPRVTIQELDEQKNINPSHKVRERAKRVLKNLEKWFESPTAVIRPGVQVRYYGRSPSIDHEKYGLKPTWRDDILIATILEYKTQQGSEEVFLVTQDSGPRLTAREVGIKAYNLADDLKLPIEMDPVQQENEELRRRIKMIEAAQPILSLKFALEDGMSDRILWNLARPSSFSSEEITRRLAEERIKWFSQYPKPKVCDDGLEIASDPITPGEYSRFQGEVERYLEESVGVLKEKWHYENALRLTKELTIELVNTGSQPGKDVDILLHFPDGFLLFDNEQLSRPPSNPRPPTPPRTIRQINLEMLARISNLTLPLPNLSFLHDMHQPKQNVLQNVFDFEIRKVESYEVNVNVRWIKHGDRVRIPPLYVMFDSFDGARSFGIDYQLRPVNLPEPVNGRLNVILEKTIPSTES